jgi:hypothetical protein
VKMDEPHDVDPKGLLDHAGVAYAIVAKAA